MKRIFPTIGQYNQHFRQNGNEGFHLLRNIVLLASRNVPVKIFLFGSGAYAAVFKGIHDGKTFAIRCFLTVDGETVSRYNIIGDYLRNISGNWKVDFQFMDNELTINNALYPVLKMEWVEGQLLNEFISQNLYNNSVLEQIQEKLFLLSRNLEKLEIGHGDLQFGNIMVVGNANSFTLKLIDYDGMYVPDLNGKKALELGRSEFQHPRRTAYNFNPRMDRFSFWVILTGLEAIKLEKSLWQPVMQGGYNTLDNCLFTANDFTNPHQSELFQKLQRINNSSLNYYIEKLKTFCLSDINLVEAPKPYKEVNLNEQPNEFLKYRTKEPQVNPIGNNLDFRIECVNESATVLTSSFAKIGQTPLFLKKDLYQGKTIIVSNGKESKQIKLNDFQSTYLVEFSDRSNENQEEGKVNFVIVEDSKTENDNRIEDIRNEIAELERKRYEKEREEEEEINKLRKESEERKRLEEAAAHKELLKKQEDEKKKKEKPRRKWVFFFLISLFVIGSILIFKKYSSNTNKPSKITTSTKTKSYAGSPITPLATKVDELTIINHPDIIRKILEVEEKRNFNKIFSFYSPSMRRYWDIENPTFNGLKNRYEYIWGFTSNSKNKIKKIEKVNSNTFDLYTNFSYYNIKKGESFETNSVIRYVFDYNGKITETYGIKQNIQSQNSSNGESAKNTHTPSSPKNTSVTKSVPPNNIYYKYKTKFDDPLFEIPLRSKPSMSGTEIYKCPKNADIYVIDNSGDIYFEVYVDGYTGYITKNYLKRKY